MAGDYTRFTFDPVKGFSGVQKQQGRVSLDSEFNEFEEILDRRDRAEMYDTVGQAVVPADHADGFKIGVGGGGKLTIGSGRAYVDGILAECFGDMSNPANTSSRRASGRRRRQRTRSSTTSSRSSTRRRPSRRCRRRRARSTSSTSTCGSAR